MHDIQSKTHFLFSKSRAWLGTLGPVDRARVADLWGEGDGEKTAGPTQRALNSFVLVCCRLAAAMIIYYHVLLEAAQRGVGATKEILLGLLDGLSLQPGSQVLVVEALVSRTAFC